MSFMDKHTSILGQNHAHKFLNLNNKIFCSCWLQNVWVFLSLFLVGFFFFKQNLDNWNFFILLIQVRKPKYWTEDIQFNKVHCIGWSHSPAGGIHVCGGYSSILSSLLHFLLNVSIVTDRYDFQSISCNIQIGRCKNLILSFSLSLPSLSHEVL